MLSKYFLKLQQFLKIMAAKEADVGDTEQGWRRGRADARQRGRRIDVPPVSVELLSVFWGISIDIRAESTTLERYLDRLFIACYITRSWKPSQLLQFLPYKVVIFLAFQHPTIMDTPRLIFPYLLKRVCPEADSFNKLRPSTQQIWDLGTIIHHFKTLILDYYLAIIALV